MFHDGVKISIRDIVRKVDSQYHVIEGTARGEFRTHNAAINLSHHVIRLDTDFVKHGTEQRSLIFAIAVLVLENGGGRVRLVSSNADFDGDVTDLPLHEIGESPDFVDGGWRVGGQLGYFLFNLRRGLAAVGGKASVPKSDIFPRPAVFGCAST